MTVMTTDDRGKKIRIEEKTRKKERWIRRE
jgi:hypothetical protein